ncbi:MAG: hypothetical protein U5R06_06165 [candidate division KSB1 bacterium]|nr:hypothetical protein [candidate division KSB1 bacterium]
MRGYMEQNRLRTEYLIKGLSRLGCTSINPGIRDFSLGVEYLLKLQKETNVDFVSANVYYYESGKRVFEPFVISTVESNNAALNPIKIGILGLCQPKNVLVPEHSSDIQVQSKSLYESIKDPLAKLSKKADIVILLYHGTFSNLKVLMDKNPEIDVVVLGGQYYAANQYQWEMPALVSSPPLGKYLSKLELVLDGNQDIITYHKERLPLDEDVPDDPEMQELIRDYNEEQ